MAAVVLQPHMHVSQAAVDMQHVMSQVIYDASEMQLVVNNAGHQIRVLIGTDIL